MATLYEKISIRWQNTLEEWKKNGASPDALMSLVENTLPAIVREEITETAKEQWYSVISSMVEAEDISEEEFALVKKDFADKVYSRLQNELDQFISDFTSGLLEELRKIAREYDYRFDSLQKYWAHRLEEEKRAVESAIAVERRKFINLLMNQLVEDLKSRLESQLLQEADIYAHYVKHSIGNRSFEKILIAGLPETVAAAFRNEFGKDKVEVGDGKETGLWVISGASRWDFSPAVVVNEVVTKNLAFIRKVLYGEGSK